MSNKELTFEVLSPWMRVIDADTIINIIKPIVTKVHPIQKYITLISENMPNVKTKKKVGLFMMSLLIMSFLKLGLFKIELLLRISLFINYVTSQNVTYHNGTFHKRMRILKMHFWVT